MADILNVDDGQRAPHYMVIAGDPVHRVDFSNKLLELTDEEKGNREQFVIDGNSMSPLGLESGDNLLVSLIEPSQITEGDFLLLEVDPDYYSGEKPNYDLKLRQAIMLVKSSWDEDEIIERMKSKDSQEEIWLTSYQKRLREKYQKVRAHYKNCDLILSATYRHGRLDYSFHNVDYICYRVEVVIHKQDRSFERFPKVA
ncbi:hypothetical protein [uncultured Bacteroides sp.]|uniref:hypothetical protein n=1 Tax=uncultured Bacteroides sp. TaxID=162156 RepID=UPI002619B93A|nr:hypothetical protein [uncultured Bacteroides sp.]